MSRYAIPSVNPPEATYEGDSSFTRMNMKRAYVDSSTLQPGEYEEGINTRIVGGALCKRPGSIMPAFANVRHHVLGGLPSMLGTGIYSNPRASAEFLMATATEVWRTTDSGYPQKIALPAGVTLSGRVRFVQAFDKVLLLRGEEKSKTILEWNGTPTGSFKAIKKKDPLNHDTAVTPPLERAVIFANCLVFPLGRSNIGKSDPGDYTSYDPVFENFPANLGFSDVITSLFTYPKSGLIIGKRNRIELLSGFTDPNHPENAELQTLSSSVGTCAWDSWLMVGGDVWFLSNPGGVFRVAEVIQDRLEAVAVPISEEIEPIIRRINWKYAAGAVAGLDGIYYKLAVPLDNSPVNNCLLVFNTVTKACEGYDLFDSAAGMQVDDLLPFTYHGDNRLYAANYADRTIHLLEEGKFDETLAGRFEITDLKVTRGYSTESWAGATVRDDKRLELSIKTWSPWISVSAVTDRALDARPLHRYPVTHDPRKWVKWGKKACDLTNLNADQMAPGRQDYSIPLEIVNDPGFDPQDGFAPEQKQSEVLPFSTRIRSRYVALRIQSTQGDCDLCATRLESAAVQRANRRAA